ncbi:phage conserved hypothetical protein [Salinihabitans flavidus]|uniref:Phage tail assembly chaperone protein, TAC n=1 Tax=Salinihabitans flavidus TaxID=569882 RepID=A0A1H8Q9L6_9RHOB|nr:rcc01693 family protein [Salinihabitans flavidus]SEO50746.1 phage conserved hypothetical protein [Salinihabitans flavidus]
MSGFDWPALLRAGLHGLRLSPEAFWALTPAELRMMLGERESGRPLSRGRLEELQAAYPDDTGGTGDDGD